MKKKLSEHIFASVYVCTDKPCSQKKKRIKKLLKLFPSAKKTKCMGVCNGPVVLIKKEKKKYYCRKIRKKQDRQRLWDFVVSGVKSKKIKIKT